MWPFSRMRPHSAGSPARRSGAGADGLNLSDVWSDISPVRHRTAKTRPYNELSPLLAARALHMSSVPRDLVLDPFGGSGTTYVVAEAMGRRWSGIELGDVQPIVARLRGQVGPRALARVAAAVGCVSVSEVVGAATGQHDPRRSA